MDWRDTVFDSTYDIDSLDNRDEALIARVSGLSKWLQRYHRAEVRGVERIPSGAGLYVGNHNAPPMTIDSWLFGAAVYHQLGIADVPYGLGHEWMIRVRGAHPWMVRLGAVRACHDNAHRLFEAGHKVLVYPGGDVDSCRPYRDRHRVIFDGRKGYIRLALRKGVPIIPVVSCGAQSVWVVLSDMRWLAKTMGFDKWLRIKVLPLALSVPWGLTLGLPMPFIPLPVRILIEVLEPIRFERHGEEAASDEAYVDACATQVEFVMQECLDKLADERRKPR
jgi:1-acyl-sn-glycerol-3-phosphate acyltransferase